MNRLNKEQLEQIRERIMPAADFYSRTGTLKGIDLPGTEVIQALHIAAFGYKYDPGCPVCIGDAIRLLGNVYREQQLPEPSEQETLGSGMHLVTIHPDEDLETTQFKKERATAFLQKLRDAAGRFVKGDPQAQEQATIENRAKLPGERAIAIEVPDELLAQVRDIIEEYHIQIDEALNDEQAKRTMEITTIKLTELLPDKAEIISLAMAQQWQWRITEQNNHLSPGDTQPGEEDPA